MLCSMRKTLLFLMMLGTLPVSAAVYKWVDGSGQVHYGDQPSRGATEVELPETMVYTPPEYNTDENEDAESGDQTNAVAGGPYKSLAIVQPSNDETIRSNNGNVAVSIEIIPGLVEGNKFVVYLDGSQVGELTTPQITLQNVDRGTHSLEIAVTDGAGREIVRSAAVSFHLRRHSDLLPNSAEPENPTEPPPDDADPEPDNPIEPPPGDDDNDGGGDDADVADDVDGDDDSVQEDGGNNGGDAPTLPPRGPYTPNFQPKYSPRAFQP